MVAFEPGLVGRKWFCWEGSPGGTFMERAQLELMHGRGESFEGMGKVSFGWNMVSFG